MPGHRLRVASTAGAMVIIWTMEAAKMTEVLSPNYTAITGRAAQWVGLLMLVEVYGFVALICLR